jgi:hypothetical protein
MYYNASLPFRQMFLQKMYTKDIHFLHIDKRRGNYYNDS